MKRYPLILEGGLDNFVRLDSPGDVPPKTNSSFITTGRGNLVALQPYVVGNSNNNPESLTLDLEVNGISVLESTPLKNFDQYTQGNAESKILPLSAGEGSNTFENYKLIDGASVSDYDCTAVILKMYEGFKIATEDYNNLQTKVKSYSIGFAGNEVPPTVASPVLEGTLPKDKGRIKGFYITFGINKGFWNQASEILTLRIAGTEIIKEVPASYFLPQYNTVKTFYFDEPLEGGQTFDLTVLFTAVTFTGYASVNWIFEENEK